MQGQVNLAAGIMHLTPMRWLERPSGYVMVGMEGASHDGGLSFHGRVVADIPGCSGFVLSRQPSAGQ
jgi:hypothetical protein